jgi:transcriptional regulator with XRE-family HTH domain
MRAIRVARGLSQEALAELANLHRTYVGSIERRERNVSLDNVEKLALALGVDICDLLSTDRGGDARHQCAPLPPTTSYLKSVDAKCSVLDP